MKTLKQLRSKINATQEEVAKAIGVSYQAYANYEAGRREPNFDMLLNLSKYYNVTVDYLLTGKEPVKQQEAATTPKSYIDELLAGLTDTGKNYIIGIAEGMYRLENGEIPTKITQVKQNIEK